MRKMDKKACFILISSALFMFSAAGTRPLVPLFSRHLGASPADIGIIVAVFSLLPLFLSLHAGKLVDKMGPRYPLLGSICFGGIALTIPWFITSLPGIYASQIMMGVSQMMFVVAVQAFAGMFEQEKAREFYVFIFSIGAALGSFAGPLCSGIMSQHLGYALTFALAGSPLFLSMWFVFWLHMKAPQSLNMKQPGRYMDFLKQPRLRKAFLISALVLLGKEMYIAYFPLLAEEHDLSNAFIGAVVSVNAGAGVLIRFLLPVIVQKWSRGFVICASVAAIGMLYVLHPFLEHAAAFLVVSFVLGLCLGIGQPLSISATISELPAERVGEGLGVRLSINKLTQVVMPVFAGAAANVIGIAGVFYIIGGIVLLGSTKTNMDKDTF
ncbi:MFS transporter [Salibacterium halotolerans]|uniref:Predicted arabinose efflux permease, MFS family n=1 Tax=Salibacterium halotolerans TaxID=1884432 RepID=A0A1I5PCE5_9BACI|nr:MFS transporter [Salibacterium halotolerans]SFP31577.1 Predicted arabinose efflux permease, MFS family [Salibacterium halotolerans]